MPRAFLSSRFDSPLASAGATYKIPDLGNGVPHLWVVLTDPDENGEVAMVSLTTRRKGSDDTVILDSHDHPFVIRETAVSYGNAMCAAVQNLTNAVCVGAAFMHRPVSQDLLTRIQDGAQRSPHTPKDVKEYVCRRLRSKHKN